MADCKRSCISIDVPCVNAVTLPTGPRGAGISEIEQKDNKLTVTYDNGDKQVFELPDWWFGTRDEYNSLSDTEKTEKSLYFIEEGT